MNKEQARSDKAHLKEEVENLRNQLETRDEELKVIYSILIIIHHESHMKDLIRRQEILAKSQRRQMGVEMRKRQALKKQLGMTQETLQDMEMQLKV